MHKLQFRDRRQEPVWLVDENFTIGKNKTNSLVIDAPSISDKHAEIVQQNRKMLIRDLGAEKGIFINGVRVIGEHPLSPGNIIKLGDVELEIVDPKHVSAPPAEEEAEWKLLATASWMNGQTFEVRGSMVLGRDSACDIAIPVEHLSRRHAELSVQGARLVVKDLDSSNGTFVNGERVEEATLKPGDKLKFDVITFTVQGPDHDPNKTIIRQAVDFKKEVQEELRKRAELEAKKAAEAAKAPPVAKASAPKAAPKESARKQNRPMAVTGKKEDSWITEAPSAAGKSSKAIIIAMVIIAAVAGAAAMFLT